MAGIPTFDYLSVARGNNSATVKYVIKSSSINFTGDCDKSEPFKTMMDSILLYLGSLQKAISDNAGVLVKGQAPTFSGKIPLIKIYADSITIRTSNRGQALPTIPLRRNGNSQLIKVPFANISETFESEVQNFIIETDAAAQPK